MERPRTKRDWPALIEALGVFVLVMLYIWKLRMFHPWLWMVILGFVAGSHFPHGEGALELGLRWKGFRASLRAVLPWTFALAALLLAGGLLFGTMDPGPPPRMAVSLLVYFAWGLFQQYLLNGYFLNRLTEFFGGDTRSAAVAATALFSAAHFPNWFLMGVTLAGGYVATLVFLRYRSLYALGLAHGLLGFLLNLVVPDSISGNFLVGPRYLLHHYGFYPEELL